MKTDVDSSSSRPRFSFEVQKIRKDFPILEQKVHGKPLVYLDNAATTQKPQVVLDTLLNFYTRDCSNVHRGVHLLSGQATEAYENSRAKIRRFINAVSEREIVFVRGATEGINLVAQTYGRIHVGPGDEILISAMEHHSNIVPWQMLCQEKEAKLRVIPINPKGELICEAYEDLVNSRTRLVAVTQVSNVLGTVNPVSKIIKLAHQQNVPVLVDGAQAVQHMRVDVQALDCDFYVMSGHKMYGPTGIGVLYGKERLLEEMPPYQGGGEMISSVTFEKTLYNKLPYKFEAGTPNIAGGIAFGAAVGYIESIGLDNIIAHEQDLLAYVSGMLATTDRLRIIGTADDKASILSFTFEGVHSHDIGTILDQEGIAIRSGHHCAQPLMNFFSIPATARVSLGLYNTREDIDALTRGLEKVQELFK